MTKIILNDARLTPIQPTENWLDRLRSFIVWIEQHARKNCSHMGVHPDHEIVWTKHHNGTINPDMCSSLLVRESDVLPLRVDSALPNCPLVCDRYAAEMVVGESS